MFVSIYFLILVLLVYFKNKRTFFEYPQITKNYSVSVIIPAYNEEDTIEDTVKAVMNIDYSNISEIIVVNDGSKDNTLKILKSLKIKYKNLKIFDKENSGKADSLNQAVKICKGELVAVVDADSYPEKDSFSKIIGFFDDSRVGAATVSCFARNRKNFLEKLQVIDYKAISFVRKLLQYLESIYVIPGPLGMYRKKALLDIAGFDKNNLTEDIEATWHLIHNGWKIRMSLASQVSTTTPAKFKPWYAQRRRWAIGGLQCLNKYKSCMLKKCMLGYFIIPFFGLGLFLGLIGIAIFLYLFARRTISSFLMAKYSLAVDVPLLTASEIFITPSVLNYLGIVLFVMFLFFTFFVLSVMKDRMLGKQSFFNVIFYMTVYTMSQTLFLVVGAWNILIGKKIWGSKK
jgi:cellulose synthase/poly-beta-1,6-N-acetylglucosamine synthase-like glycosyltransferase